MIDTRRMRSSTQASGRPESRSEQERKRRPEQRARKPFGRLPKGISDHRLQLDASIG